MERGLNLPIHSPRLSAEAPVASVDWRYVTEGYFETMQIPLREGRLLDARDTAGSQPVALVNEAFARRLLEAGRAVGSEVRIYEAVPGLRDAARTIVGVVGTVKTGGSLALPPVPTMFVPVEQVPAGLLATVHSFIPVNWLVRTTGSSPELLATVEDTLGDAAGPIPVSGLRTMDQVIGAVVTEERFRAVLLTIFALASLVLAAAGLYAVMAFMVRQRTREVGIPACARGDAIARAAVVPGPGVVARGLRRGRGAGRHLPGRAPPAGLPVRHSAFGCADGGRGRRRSAGSSGLRLLGADPLGHAHSPNHRASVRVGTVAPPWARDRWSRRCGERRVGGHGADGGGSP